MPNHPLQNKIKNTNIIIYLALFSLSITLFLYPSATTYGSDNTSSNPKMISERKEEIIIPKQLPGSSLQKGELTELQKQARLYRSQGLEQQNIGNIEEAMSLYQKAIELDSAYAVVYNDLGIIYEAIGDVGRAEDSYQKALTIDPNYISVYSNLALLYEGKGEMDKALFYWRERAGLGAPSDPWTQKAKARLADLMRTMPEFKRGLMEKEREYIQREREQEIITLSKIVAEQKKLKKQEDSKEAKKHLSIARELYNSGEYNKALSELSLVLSLNPKEEDALTLKGKIKAKIIEQEKKAREEKKKLNIKNMQAHFETGIRYYQQDDLQQALEEFAKIETLVTSPQKK